MTEHDYTAARRVAPESDIDATIAELPDARLECVEATYGTLIGALT